MVITATAIAKKKKKQVHCGWQNSENFYYSSTVLSMSRVQEGNVLTEMCDLGHSNSFPAVHIQQRGFIDDVYVALRFYDNPLNPLTRPLNLLF